VSNGESRKEDREIGGGNKILNKQQNVIKRRKKNDPTEIGREEERGERKRQLGWWGIATRTGQEGQNKKCQLILAHEGRGFGDRKKKKKEFKEDGHR